MAYRGPRGGEGWQNEAGKVRYVKDQPGRRGHAHGSTVAVTPETPANELFQAVRAWQDTLTPAQKQMLFSWGGSGLNTRLAQAGRSAEIGQHERKPSPEDLRAWDELLDSAPKFKGEVYRGMSRIPDGVIAQWLGNGEIVLDNDQSSSRTTTEAEGWRGRGMRGMASVLWRVKQQTGALVENATGVYYGDDPQLGGKNESEVILRQGTRYRIADVRYIDDRGQEFPPPDYAEWLRFQKEDELQERVTRIQDTLDRYEKNDVIPHVIEGERERLRGVEAELEAVKAQKGKAELPDNFLPHQHAWGHYVFDLEEILDEPVGKKVPQVESPEFRRWFNESKVVGDDGGPLVLYHGTRADFQEFKPGPGGGMFFTVSPDVASGYSVRYGKNPLDDQFEALRQELKGRGISEWDLARQPEWKALQDQARLANSAVYPVYLSVKRPLVLDGETQADEVNAIKDNPERIAELKRQGYDGILIRNANDKPGIHYTAEDAALYERADLWVVFDPRQVKSAIGNLGTFDPESKKINESFDESKVKRDREGQFARQEGRGSSAKSDKPARREQQDIATPRTPKIETPEFKNWFGDWTDPLAFTSKRDPSKPPVSMAVDEDGKPRVFYHGTLGDFDEFQVGREGTNSGTFGSWKTQRHAVFLSPTPELANAFTSQGGETEGGNVKPVFLSVKAPLDLRSGFSQADLDEFAQAGMNPRWLMNNAGWELFDDEDGKLFVETAQKLGYDGVIFTDDNPETGDSEEAWAVFRPEQIKSAISNRGTYDPENPKIGESFAREAWIEYDGPRGGEGWENTETGKVAYVKEQPGRERESRSTEPSVPKVPPKTTPDARDVLTPQQFGDYLKQNADKWFLDQDAIDNEVARYARRGVKDKLEQMQAADYPLKLDSGQVDLRMSGSHETERIRLTPSADDLRKLWMGKIDLDPNDTIFVRHQTSPQWQREFMELGIDTRTAPPDSRLGRLTATDKGFVQSRIDEPGLFVEPNTVSDVGGPYGVILQVKAGQIKPSPESTGLGYKTGLEGLYGAKDAILAGEVIPPENVVGIYDYDHAAGKPVWIPNPRNPNSGKLRVGPNGGLEMIKDAGPPEPVAKTDTPEFKAWFGNSQVVDERGKPLVLYHGTNRALDAFDPDRQRTARNSQFQGDGFFFTEDPEVAERYADAAVNQSFDRETVLREMRERHPGVLADLLENQIDHGYEKGWELTLAKYGLEDKPIQDWPAELREHGNDINDLADFVEGSRSNEREEDVSDVFAAMSGGGPQGLPKYALDLATKLGLSAPAPAIMPVYLRAEKILHTDDPEEAKTARQRGYDAVRYTGPDRVGDAAEWIVFEPDQIKSASGNRGTYERGNPKITETRWRGRVTEPLVFEREFDETKVKRDREGQFAKQEGRTGDTETLDSGDASDHGTPGPKADKLARWSSDAVVPYRQSMEEADAGLQKLLQVFAAEDFDGQRKAAEKLPWPASGDVIKTLETERREWQRKIGVAKSDLREAETRHRIARAVSTPEFREWFGNASDVTVGGDGLPIVLYHGTDNPVFTEFRVEDDRDDVGVFTSSDPVMAASYTKRLSTMDVTPLEAVDVDHIKDVLWDPAQIEVFYVVKDEAEHPTQLPAMFPTKEEAIEYAKTEYVYEDGESPDQDIVPYYRIYSQDGQIAIEGHDPDQVLYEFNDNPELRRNDQNGGGGLYSLFGRMEEPMIVDAKGANWDEIEVESEDIDGNPTTYRTTTRELSHEAHQMGYDGLVIRNVVDYGGAGSGGGPQDVYVFYNEKNLKSIHNKGTWNRQSGNILETRVFELWDESKVVRDKEGQFADKPGVGDDELKGFQRAKYAGKKIEVRRAKGGGWEFRKLGGTYWIKPNSARAAEIERQFQAHLRKVERGTKATSEEPKSDREAAHDGEPWRGGKIRRGQVYNIPTGELQVDPERFQFKIKVNKEGVTEELKSVRVWNPDFAGVLGVWRDPVDGKTYCVNGHHRAELANRLGVEELPIRYFEAATAEEARALGALTNIAEGRGTAVDAAKFMRDSGYGLEEFEKRGVSLKGKVSADALVLLDLSDRSFDRVVREQLDTETAVAVARELKSHELQDQLFRVLEKREQEGKDTSLRVIGEMAREMAETPVVRGKQASLWGDVETEDSLFVPRNELKAAVRADLVRQARDFELVANRRRAEAVAGAGNVLNLEQNRKLAQDAQENLAVYNGLVNRRGPISDALNAGAARYAEAKSRRERDAVRRETIEAVRDALAQETLDGRTAGPPDGASPGIPATGSGTPAGAADAGRGDPGKARLSRQEVPPGERHVDEPTPDDPQAPWRGGEIKSGRVYNAPVSQLHVDPERFQFKLHTDAQGVTQELKQVRTWNPDFAGVVSVWRDPQDGKTWVVNGHHRYELANRLGVQNLAIRYLEAETHVEARAKGALINIAEGRGTAVDAAKFLKDLNLRVEDIQERGVSLKGKVAGDATVLAGLSDQAFDRLVRGTLDTDVALAVGRGLQDNGLQDQLFGLLERREEAGRDTSLRTIGEMARELAEKHAPRPDQTGKRLFEPDTLDPLFEPRNELKALIQADMTREARDFAAVASRRRAEAVADAGNILNLKRNREISDEAERILSIYQTLKNRRGIIADALEAGAAEWSQATTKGQRDAIRTRTLRSVRDAVLREAGEGDAGAGTEVAGRPGPDAARGEPDAGPGPRDAGRRNPPTLGLKFAESASEWDPTEHPRGDAGKFARKTEAPMLARHRTSRTAAQSIRQSGFDLSRFGHGAGAGVGEPEGVFLSLPGEEADFEKEVQDRRLGMNENLDVEIAAGATVLDWDDRERRVADQQEAARRYIKRKYGLTSDEEADLVRKCAVKQCSAIRPELGKIADDYLMAGGNEQDRALSRELAAMLRERGVDVVQWRDPWRCVRQVDVINPKVLLVKESATHPLARIVALLESRQAPQRYLVRESIALESNPNWDETKVKRDQGGRFAEQEGRGGKAERDLPPLPDTITLGPGDEFLQDLKRYQGSDESEFGTYEVPYRDGKLQLSDEQFERVKDINKEIRNVILRERTRGWYAEARQNLRTPATELTREVFAARERLKELAQVRRDRDRHGEFFKSLRDAIDREDWRAVGELNDLVDESRSLKIVRNRYGDVLMSDKTPYAGTVWRNMNGREEWLLQKQDESYWSEDDLHAKHEQAVKEAVLAGKPVSDEVLAPYWYSDWMPKERYDAWRMKDMRDRRAERVNSKEALEAFEKLQPEFSRFADEMERRGVVEKAAAVWNHEESRVRELMVEAEKISNERTELYRTSRLLQAKLEELETMGPEAAAAAGFDLEARRNELKAIKDRDVELAVQGKPIANEMDNRRRLANQWFLEDVMKQMGGKGGLAVELDAKDFPHAQQHADHMTKATAFLGRVAAPVMGAIRAKVVPYTNKDQRSRAGGQEMEMAEIAGPTTYVHELGHVIEDQLGLHPKCFGFLVGQVRGLPVEHMGQGYEPDEFAVKDDFRNKYAGKIYPYAATEILSMGLQELYTNPYGFAKESPRHFWFTLAALQGKLR